MPEELPKYADIILPLALRQYYTYRIPESIRPQIKTGSRVTVVLGKRRIYTALVRTLHNHPSGKYELSEILSLLDEIPMVDEMELGFWEWIAEYYMCTTGEVYKAAFPSGLKLESETRIFLRDFEDEELKLSSSDLNLIRLVASSPSVSIKKLTNASGKKDLMPAIKRLIEKGVFSIEEILKRDYKPKISFSVELDQDWEEESKLATILNELEKRAPKQAALIENFIKLTAFGESAGKPSVLKNKLIQEAQATNTTLNALINKKVFRLVSHETSRLALPEGEGKMLNTLNNKQAEAFENIKKQFSKKDVVLLHGVTSSGKTEIYIQLIEEYLKMGRQVLYLLPEIALTTQIIQRLRVVFGNRVGVYHSKFTDSERVEVFQNLCGIKMKDSPEYQIILGVRSSIFLPFKNLGLVIVDEEHENTYKQFDPAPRYNARDAAIVLAGMHKGKVLMGTATPSFESYMNAMTGRYGLVELNARYLDIQLPEIKVVNVREARRKKQMRSNFSPVLIQEMTMALERKEQIILFQNRRGYSPYIECTACGSVPHCKNCDVSLTFHKRSGQLRCHYCGYSIPNPAFCAVCGSGDVETRGFGTEKVEDEIQALFPDHKISRLDLDTTRTRNLYEKIIENFENRKIDILIGTQMISKGLDFNHVRVVGILNADNMLNFPDFRSFERSFQLIAQVSGRAGRRHGRGIVVLQTGDPEHTVIRNLINDNYSGFFRQQVAERKDFYYPPYSRLIKLTLRHRNLPLVSKAADLLADDLRKFLGNRVVGPEFPLLNRAFGLHQKCILIKLERDKNFSGRKNLIREAIGNVSESDEFRGLQIVPDVDPFN
jgi:primosomal protein N' (replication factor Y) (superfamily II helicase)